MAPDSRTRSAREGGMPEGSAPADAAASPELSVVMPCLNEAETLGRCIEKARRAMQRLGISGEVIVADNGSTDASPAIAVGQGARVVPVSARGYGNALRGGIEAARGKFVIIGDSDDSYDFSSLDPFVAELRGGADLVMGNRFQGTILPGAMPWKHRWIGNPVLTSLGRLFFRSPVGDFHCGLRAFSRDAYRRMDLRTTGMEFASEMVIKSTLKGLRIAEVPIVLHKDGRSRPPHLRSWRDGWRHLRFMLLFSPLWLFVLPGLVMLGAGGLLGGWLLGGARRVGSLELGVHTLLGCSFLVLLGYQVVIFGLFTKAFAVHLGLHPSPDPSGRWTRLFSLELGLWIGLLLVLAGAASLLWAVEQWRAVSFGPLDPKITMRRMIPAVTLLSLGVQTVFSSFLLGILSLAKSERRS